MLRSMLRFLKTYVFYEKFIHQIHILMGFFVSSWRGLKSFRTAEGGARELMGERVKIPELEALKKFRNGWGYNFFSGGNFFLFLHSSIFIGEWGTPLINILSLTCNGTVEMYYVLLLIGSEEHNIYFLVSILYSSTNKQDSFSVSGKR